MQHITPQKNQYLRMSTTKQQSEEGLLAYINSPKELGMKDENDSLSSFHLCQSSSLAGTAFIDSCFSLDYSLDHSKSTAVADASTAEPLSPQSPSSYVSPRQRKRQPQIDQLPPLSPPFKKAGVRRRSDSITCSPAGPPPRRLSLTRPPRSPMARSQGGGRGGILRRGGLRMRRGSLSPMAIARPKVKFMLPDDASVGAVDEDSMNMSNLEYVEDDAYFLPANQEGEDPKKSKPPIPTKECLKDNVVGRNGSWSQLAAMAKFGESCTSSFGESCTDFSFDPSFDDSAELSDCDEEAGYGSGNDSDSEDDKPFPGGAGKRSVRAFNPKISSSGGKDDLDLSDSFSNESPTGVASFPSQEGEEDWGNDSGVDLLVPKIRSQSLVSSTTPEDMNCNLGTGREIKTH